MLAQGTVLASENSLSDSTLGSRFQSDRLGGFIDSLRRRVAGRIIITAHRGFSSVYPGNSMEAFEAAMAAGADLIETDVRMSADGILVCHHDPDIDGQNIADTPAQVLDGLGINRLSAVLSQARGQVGILLDLKIVSDHFAGAVLKLIRSAAMESQIVIGVRSIDQAGFLRRSSDDVVLLGFLQDYGSFPRFYDSGGDIARLWEEHVTPRLLTESRHGEHPVWITTRLGKGLEPAGAIDRHRLETLFRLEVDGVLVNDSAAALAQRAISHGDGPLNEISREADGGPSG